MSASILVAYATKQGSTQEVAEAIAAALREDGTAVDCRPLKEVKTLEGYAAVVVGAPLYMFRWHKDAKIFLSRHRQALMARPVAVFAMGPLKDEAKDWQDVRAQLDKELLKFPWLAPVAAEVFGGKHDPAKLSFPYNLIPALKQMPASDIRDWTAIRAWAIGLTAKLAPSGA
jgi:menaquinone-dependent protoporphyrinogen oxidase